MKYNVLIILLTSLLCSSCAIHSLDLKKFVSRLNHHEYTSSSGYIYEEDLSQLSFFTKEVMTKCPNAYLSIENCELKDSDQDNRYLSVKFRWNNYNDILKQYFLEIGRPLDDNGFFSDSIKIFKTIDGDKLAFNWGLQNIDNSKLCVGSIANTAIKRMNIRKHPNTSSTIISSLENGDKIIIDNNSTNKAWSKTYIVDNKGNIQEGYIYKKNISETSNVYFNPGIFDSMGIFLLFIISIIILLPLLVIKSIIYEGCFGSIFAIALIFGCLYVFYQCIEKICFELFLINLPH